MKRVFKVGTAIILLLATSCVKESLQNLSSTNVQTNDNATQKTTGHYIGERFGGGVIFFMNGAGTHGLIADTVDLPPTAWGTYSITRATGIAIGTGPLNTRKIISAQGTTGTYAALECARSTRSGYTDWFLPSKDELNKLYIKRSVVGVFAVDYYSSSSEDRKYTAWEQYFSTGAQNVVNKKFSYNVRAVRAF